MSKSFDLGKISSDYHFFRKQMEPLLSTKYKELLLDIEVLLFAESSKISAKQKPKKLTHEQLVAKYFFM